MSHLIEVAFRGNRKEFFQWDEETAPPLKAGIIVEADRGEDFGRVHSTGQLAEVRCRGCAHGCGTTPPPRKALRLATREEDIREREMAAENETARRRGMERVKANNLVMKLSDAEWQWDRRKLTFYFTAERRVDFRALVRDLAAMFRTRIELKQIGVRDEAKRLSGVGRCGREYCSSSWLPDLRPVNLGVAKDQKLSLNPQQISGACGRLMCCLRYEHEFYVQSRRRFPKEGKILQTSLGEEKVVSCDIFHERVTLRTAEGDTRVVPLAELREEIGSFGDSHGAEIIDTMAYDTEDVAYDSDAPSTRSRTRTPPRASARVQPDVPRLVPKPEPRADTRVESRAEPRREESRREESRREESRGAAAAALPTPATPVPPTAVVPSEVSPPSGKSTTVEPSAVQTPIGHAPIADAPIADAPIAASASGASANAGRENPESASAESASVEGTGDEPRRKRRRGRRGGRRLRAAEQRRQAEGGTAGETLAEGEQDEDDDEDGHSGNASSDR